MSAGHRARQAYLRRREVGRDALLWSVVANVVVSVLYFPATRYRAPMEFVLLFYAAVALSRWRESRVAGRLHHSC